MTESQPLFAQVALGIPQEEPYEYRVPEAITPNIKPGCLVKVPLGTRFEHGVVVSLQSEPKLSSHKVIDALISDEPVMDAPLLKVCEWISRYYACSWGQAIQAALPSAFRKGKYFMKTRVENRDGQPARELVHGQGERHKLTDEQAVAYEAVLKSLRERKPRQYLLYGVTGSGKTEVYLQLIDELIREGRGSIVLIPEISLTPQTVDRFESRFGPLIAVMHSRIAEGKRVQEWKRIREGRARVVVGARSAIFSPVQDLSLIVIDEEQEETYKQDETPRYDAGEVAWRRCQEENAVLIRGSATPRLESYFLALEGRMSLLKISDRIAKRPMPLVEIVDMRNEPRGRNPRLISTRLELAIQGVLKKREQVMLFLNRRGFSPYVSCENCGHTLECGRCRVTMVYHYSRKLLLCHLCNQTQAIPGPCPRCHKPTLRFQGSGTEKIESEIMRLFPEARLKRMDSDSTSKKSSFEDILKAFRKREIDILLGTQMIAKGHDFPGVSLIGVISSDTALHLPDFRSAERTFTLLTQVAGRAGRDQTPGRVFLQTYVPDHYAIQAAKNHDYERFYKTETEFRKELNYPPYAHLVEVILAGLDEAEAYKAGLELRRLCEHSVEKGWDEILGPSPCIVAKLRNRYRWQLLFKTQTPEETIKIVRRMHKHIRERRIQVSINPDPR